MHISINRVIGALMLAVFACAPVFAAQPPVGSAEPDPALVSAIIRALERDGTLDAAVGKAIDRYVQRQETARQAAEAKQQEELKVRAKLARRVDVQRDHIRGNANAEISLIEYTDIECPFCKKFHATPSALLAHFGDRVNWVVRSFPLPFHDPAARKEALAAECVGKLAGNDAYWKYTDSLFAYTKSNGGGLPEANSIEKLAAALGVKRQSLSQCMNDAAMIKRVEDDIADGVAAGVNGTPMTVIRNNRTGASEAVGGALPADAFIPTIERMLGR